MRARGVVLLAPLALSVSLAPALAHAACSWGVVGLTAGQTADVFFTPGVDATKDVPVVLRALDASSTLTDASWGNGHCEFWAESFVPGIEIQDTYGGWEVSDLEVFQGGIGTGWDFDEYVRIVADSPPAGSGVIELYADIRGGEFDPPLFRKIGRINVHVRAPTSTTFTATKPAAGLSHLFYLNHPLLDGNPTASLIVTQNYLRSQTEAGATIYNDHNIMVYYNASTARWSIFNQDFAAMPTGTTFDVRIAGVGAQAKIHVSTTSNVTGGWTYIDDPLANGNPYALVYVTPSWNPTGTYHNRAVGVWYSGSAKKWAIYNEDGSAMPTNRAFNYTVVAYPDGDTAGLHPSSLVGAFLTDDVRPVATHNWNPPGQQGTYWNERFGVGLDPMWGCDPEWYECSWSAYVEGQDGSAPPATTRFNFMLAPTPVS